MSDKNRDNAIMDEEEVILFGEKLRSTRESMGMSVQDAASRLHLSPRFILMLENENLLHTDLPLIYLRGYLRSYSKILNIPEKELTPLLEKLDPRPTTEDLAPPPSDTLTLSFPLEYSPYFTRAATLVISLMLLTGMTAWWYHHANAPTSTVVALSQPQNLDNNGPEKISLENIALGNLATENKAETPKVETLASNVNTTKPETPLTATHVAQETPSKEFPAAAPLTLAAKTNLPLASSANVSGKSITGPVSHSAKSAEASEDESADEQE